MNIVNEMVSDLGSREQAKKRGIKHPVKSTDKGVVSWQASSTIILLIGVSMLTYAIWYYNHQDKELPLVPVAQFNKPVSTMGDSEIVSVESKKQEPQHSELTKAEPEKSIAPETKPMTSVTTNAEKIIPAVQPEKLIAKPAIAPKKDDNTKLAAAPTPVAKKAEALVAKVAHIEKPEKVTKTEKSASVAKNKEQQPVQSKIITKQEPATKTAKSDKAAETTKAKTPTPVAPKKVVEKVAEKTPEKVVNQPVEKIAAISEQKSVTTAAADTGKFDKQAIQFSDAQSAKKFYAEALAKLNSGDSEAAKELLLKTLSLKSTHVPARKTLAGIYINDKQLSAAVNTLQAGIKQVPDASIFYHWLGRIYMEQGDFEKASTLLFSGSKHAKDGDYFALMALAQQNTPEFKNAIASYRQALNFQPKESKWWLGLGIVLEKAESWEEAENAYENALQSENLPFNLHSQTSSRLMFVKNQIALLKQK